MALNLDLKQVPRTWAVVDERGRVRRFPTRRDYVEFLRACGLIPHGERDLREKPELCIAIYSDWLRRGQVGCIFAQLLARKWNREPLVRTTVIRTGADLPNSAAQMASQIDEAFRQARDTNGVEGLTLLLPAVAEPEQLVHLVMALAKLPEWRLDLVRPWRKTLVLLGLRARLNNETWAEVLGMGPFPFFPYTRQAPITSLEIRTKSHGARRSKTELLQLEAIFGQANRYEVRSGAADVVPRFGQMLA